MKEVIVIGAGPAGLTAAQQLAENGYKVSVYEAGNKVGGLATSFDLWNQRVDCGPHRFFSSDTIVNDYFKRIVQDNYTLVNRLTRIYYRNKFFYYPLKPFNALSNLPLSDVVQILTSYAFQRIHPIKNPKTFEEWVINRFGKKLFSIFFKNYSEKLWGIPCSRIDADWAAQRIKKLSLWEAIKSSLFGDKKNKHKTLVDQFAYPNGGTGMIYQKMAEMFKNSGGTLHLQQPVKSILQSDDGTANGIELMNGAKVNADIVISTMPLTQMVRGLKHAPEDVKAACGKLYFRNTILVYLEINNADLFPDNWLYIHSPEVLHGRVTNFRNWGPSLINGQSSTILCLEYWCFDNDEIWKKDEATMGQLAEKEIRTINLIKPTDKVLNTFLLRIPKCYPVYETDYMKHLSIVQNYLETIPGLLVIGRYGSFKYNNQDHSILMGLLAAKQIMSGTDQHLWSINTDDDYQEKGEVRYSN